ncbi:MAG: hypothetical protein ACUVRZ_11820 [Desulfobacca sp.]|uniref:hypothetical protein n=1 Tax=Desulfobacca sp. TaxID=2067990 RepID=UPI00404B2599
MGTSSARKAPQKGAYWRKAKAAAAHYAAKGPASRLSVAEVMARYALALASQDGVDPEAPGSLPEVRRTAAALKVFYETWETQGFFTALEHLGIQSLPEHTWENLIPALLEALAGPGARLDEAVARAALLDHFVAMGLMAELVAPVGAVAAAPPLPAVDGAWHFLALALFHRCYADLGETLEFYAPTVAAGQLRQEAMKAHVLAQLNLLIALAGEADGWESQTERWFQHLLALLGNYHVR